MFVFHTVEVNKQKVIIIIIQIIQEKRKQCVNTLISIN